MALPYDTSRTLPRFSPVLPRLTPTALTPTALTPTALTPTALDHTRRDRVPSPALTRLRSLATSPTTALVVMLAGLALLFVLPAVGLPFVALVVLPAVVYHLRAEQRAHLRRAAR